MPRAYPSRWRRRVRFAPLPAASATLVPYRKRTLGRRHADDRQVPIPASSCRRSGVTEFGRRQPDRHWGDQEAKADIQQHRLLMRTILSVAASPLHIEPDFGTGGTALRELHAASFDGGVGLGDVDSALL